MKSLLIASLVSIPVLVAQGPEECILAGQVLGPDRKPLPKVSVAAVPASGDWRIASVVQSDGEGRFRLVMKPGAYALTATGLGLQEAFLGKLNPKAGQILSDLTLQMGQGGHRVTGRMVDQNGNPVNDGQVAFVRYSEDEGDVLFAQMDGDKFSINLTPRAYLIEAKSGNKVAKSKRLDLKGDIQDTVLRVLPGPSTAGPEVQSWIKGNAIPLSTTEAGHGFKDMTPLRQVVGEARVVSLGEATHGTHEFFQMKHRMLEFLVEKMGFTVFAIEANMPEARAVNEYVLTGKGDPEKALSGMYFWTWDTEEVLAMIRWMRRYNEDSSHLKKVKFYGFDMQTATVAYKSVKDYLTVVDPEAKAMMNGKLAELGRPARSSPVAGAELQKEVLEGAKALLSRFDLKRDLYIKANGLESYQWARQDARMLVQNAELMVESNTGNAVRDRCMAENTEWILDHEKDAKLVLWAHNGHVSASPLGAISGFPSMGLHLRKSLGKDMVIFGFAFRSGGFQAMDVGPGNKGLIPFEVGPHPKATLADALSSAGFPIMALDLRKLPAKGIVKEWFDSPQGSFDLGALFNAQGQDSFLVTRTVTEEFDAMFFMEKTSAAKANPSGRRGGNAAMLLKASGKAENLGFEEGAPGSMPTGWSMAPKMLADGYRTEVVAGGAKEGRQAFHLFHSTGTSNEGWATAMQSVDPTPYLGKKLRVTGWIKTDGKPESESSFWVRVDRSSGRGFFDNAKNRAVKSTEWTPLVIEGKVDSDATSLNFGCALWGTGHAWFDGLVLEVIE